MNGESSALDALQSALPALRYGVPHQGSISGDTAENLRRAVLLELSRSAASMIDARSVAFVSDAHLQYPGDTAEAELLGRTSTTIVQSLERTSALFEQLALGLESAAYIRISFSAYVSERGSSSLGNHRDAWDNIVVQLSGSKIFHFSDGNNIQLHPGDYLTIPENVVHRVSTPERSMHLSVVMVKQFGESKN